MPKLITVLGATGGQGGSVARSLLANTSAAFKVRAVTRNPNSIAAKELAAAGAEVVKADSLNKGSIASAFEDSWALHVKNGPTETVVGKMIVDAAFESRVKHVVYSGLASATEVSNGKVPNLTFDEKNAIYQYGKSKGFASFTAAAPGEYMENFTIEAIAPVFGGFPFQEDEAGFLTYRAPAWGGSGEIPYLGLKDDYGDIVHGVFLSPDEYNAEFLQVFSCSTRPEDVTVTYEKVENFLVGSIL
ncbi:hypothetical protein QQX98_011213 [Neonectria punicea]|uniref:NmrA-like domain-containing protein n=1 Tax=Neonectria punicea TaxID=979145 RepID=A0ABR1GMQ0_9HYPO